MIGFSALVSVTGVEERRLQSLSSEFRGILPPLLPMERIHPEPYLGLELPTVFMASTY